MYYKIKGNTYKVKLLLSRLFSDLYQVIKLKEQKILAFLFTSSIFFTSLSTEGTGANFYLINIFLSIYVVVVLLWFYKKKITLEIGGCDFFLLLLVLLTISQHFFLGNHLYHKSVYVSFVLFCFLFSVGKNLLRVENARGYSIMWYLTYSCLLLSLWHYFQLILCIFFGKKINVYISNSFGNTGIFAIFLSVSSLLFISHLPKKISFLKKSIFFFICLTNIFFIIYLKSRTAFLIFLIFTVGYCYFFLNNGKRKKYYFVIIFFVGITSIFLLSLYKQKSTEGRLLIWKSSLVLLKEHFFLGTGFNTFPSVYPLYQGKYYELGKMTSDEILLADSTITAFNEPLQIFCELGFIGFSIICYFSIRLLTKKNGDSFVKFMILSLCFSSFFYYVFHNSLLFLLTLIFFVILLSKEKPLFEVKYSYLKYIFPCIIPFSLFSLFFFVQKYQAIKTFEKIKKYENTIFFTDNKKVLSDNPSFLLSYAYERYNKGNYEEALKILRRLEKYVVWYHSKILEADCNNKLGYFKEAEVLYKQAISICPGKFVARHKLLNFYIENKINEKALKEAERIILLPEKIPSAVTLAIKSEAQDFLENNK